LFEGQDGSEYSYLDWDRTIEVLAATMAVLSDVKGGSYGCKTEADHTEGRA